MNELKVNGTQKFMGIDIPIVEGGFGEDCRVMTANTISEIHKSRLDKINELILNNISEFEEGVDIIDLMNDEKSLNLAKGLGFVTNNRQKHCYLLSEQGYMLLVGFMKTDKAKEIRKIAEKLIAMAVKEIRKKLRREYFTMRQIINSNEQLKATYLLTIYNGGQDAVIASKKLTEIEVEEAKKPLIEKNDTLNTENDLLAQKNLEWADRPLINSIIRAYAASIGGNFGKAWNDFKKELLYKHSINLNARITNYLNTSGKKTKPKTLDMLDDSELSSAISTAVSLCRENEVDIDYLLNNKAS